jgi:L-alanine-DL-glutamate epimerase-like enolase superfamily enzyme
MTEDGMLTDIRVVEAETRFSHEQARTPIKFGGVVMDSVVLAEVRVTVENRRGQRGTGCGAIFLADFWAFPSARVPTDVRAAAMEELTRRCAGRLVGHGRYGHPIDIARELQPAFDEQAAALTRELNLAEPLPRLLTLVSASPVDAALHDAFGLANGIDTYDGYGPEHVAHDLSRYFGPRFAGVYPAVALRPAYAERVPIFHLVGGLDKLTRAELGADDPQDGLPNCLEDWIARDGVYCLKVKLRGNDPPWDLERMLAVNRIGAAALAARGRDRYYLTGDANEICDSPDYVIELVERLRERSPAAAAHLLYVEQPTERDLARRRFDMAPLARLVPVLADESLSSDEAFDLALELGWTGPALKTCKGQTDSVLWAAKATVLGKPYAIQDLTNPGLALLQSVGLGARTSPMMGIEYNSRQFFPDVRSEIRALHEPAFVVREGEASTASLRGHGLGFRMADVEAAAHSATGLWR